MRRDKFFIHDLCLLASISTLSRNVRGWRQVNQQAPPIPKSRSGYPIPDKYKYLNSGELFLLHDSGETDENRILIFGTQSDLDAREKYDNWACDGTFKCCPEIFYQLFTIHSTVPQIFALLPNKAQETYNRLFQTLKSMCPTFQPKTLMIDFEMASVNSFSDCFTTTNVTGCFFHLCQNIFRKVVNLGLKVRYQTDSHFNTKVKCLSALAFVPVADVISVFELLSDDDEFPQELISYFELNYIGCERGKGVIRGINCIC